MGDPVIAALGPVLVAVIGGLATVSAARLSGRAARGAGDVDVLAAIAEQARADARDARTRLAAVEHKMARCIRALRAQGLTLPDDEEDT